MISFNSQYLFLGFEAFTKSCMKQFFVYAFTGKVGEKS